MNFAVPLSGVTGQRHIMNKMTPSIPNITLSKWSWSDLSLGCCSQDKNGAGQQNLHSQKGQDRCSQSEDEPQLAADRYTNHIRTSLIWCALNTQSRALVSDTTQEFYTRIVSCSTTNEWFLWAQAWRIQYTNFGVQAIVSSYTNRTFKQRMPLSTNTKHCGMTCVFSVPTAYCHGKYDWFNFLTVSQLSKVGRTCFLMLNPCSTSICSHLALRWYSNLQYAFPHSFSCCSRWSQSLLWMGAVPIGHNESVLPQTL